MKLRVLCLLLVLVAVAFGAMPPQIVKFTAPRSLAVVVQ